MRSTEFICPIPRAVSAHKSKDECKLLIGPRPYLLASLSGLTYMCSCQVVTTGSELLPSNTHERYLRKAINSATCSEFFYNYTMFAFCRNLTNKTDSRRSPPSSYGSTQLSRSEGSNRKVSTPIT